MCGADHSSRGILLSESGVSSECDREAPLSEGRDMQSRRTATDTKKITAGKHIKLQVCRSYWL